MSSIALSWEQQKALAAKVGISPTFVNDILHRRRRCPPKRAQAMSAAYFRLFGVMVPAHEFTFNDISEYPVFRPLTALEQKDIKVLGGFIDGA